MLLIRDCLLKKYSIFYPVIKYWTRFWGTRPRMSIFALLTMSNVDWNMFEIISYGEKPKIDRN